MKDYVKELNIIDFLGIVVPGTLLVLLITGDNTDLLLWEDYFGSDATGWIKGTFLLIAGYLAGMLLHEIGDCLEKGAWCFHTLDPKAYAANAVGAKKIEDAMVNANILEKGQCSQSFTYVIHPVIKGILGVFATGLLLLLSTVGFCFAMESSCYVVDNSLSHAIDTKVYFAVLGLLGAGIVLLFVLAFLLWRKYTHESKYQKGVRTALKKIQKIKSNRRICSVYFVDICNNITKVLSSDLSDSTLPCADALNLKRECILELLQKHIYNSNQSSKYWKKLHNIIAKYVRPFDTLSDAHKHAEAKDQWTMIHNICVCNPSIQTYVTDHGVHTKQAMFDSFRHVMRNLIICIAIVNAYSIWHPVEVYQDIARYFINRLCISHDFLLLCICFVITVLVMFIRYNHFVFLRYKYGFERFIEISRVEYSSSTNCAENPGSTTP